MSDTTIHSIPLTVIQIVNLFLLFVLPAVLLIWLQVRLSRKKSRWPGLILPGLHLLLAIAIVVGAGAMMFDTHSAVVHADEQHFVEDSADEPESDGDSIGIIGGADGPTAIFVTHGSFYPTDLLALLPLFLLSNIPTVIHLAIYAAFRRKRRKGADVDKSRIRDL